MTGKQKQSEQRLATSEVYCRLGDESSDSMVGIPVEESSGDVSTVIVDGGGDNLVTEPDGLARLSKFEYMNIELVGDSLLSEIKALCEIKGFTPVVESAFDPRELASSNGYKFCPSEFQSSSDRSSCTSGEANNKARGRKRHVSEMKEYKEYLDPCTSPANSKIIDDIIVLSMLLGNDFLPHSPSVLCGESALDNLLELYVSSVLPYGFLTSGSHEINLEQLRRLFESCATIEAVKFRRFQLLKGTSAPVGAEVGATVNGGRIMTVADAAKPLHSAIDDGWRDTYLGSTGLKENVLKACEKYVEGIRFVWRYYTDTVVSCDWAWYYPFYHAPLSHDVAAYLNGKNIAQITSPSVVTSPPHIYVQLLSVLPPTSHALLPTVLGEAMLRNPQDEELQQTFPTKWCVDTTTVISSIWQQ
uniref:WGS project CAEQ00000000 data, annotated contig 983 n=1 Tax=Trypanosoma congolense (strain IL3000) TaxID=1068625 RepID=F9WK36_TRYCI|nr:unnamed protein product [Trypanosoma congolense IL3000]